MATNKENYTPTEAEKRLLLVICDPECLTLSITALCEKADVVRNVYYDAMGKPGFVAFYHDTVKTIISSRVGTIVGAAIKEAETGSFQHIKLLLEMAGLHTDAIDLSSKDGTMTPKGFNDFYTETKPESSS